MTTELWYLVWSAVLALTLPLPVLAARLRVEGGLAWGLGNRERSLELPSWGARAERAHANMLENLAPFAVFVLVAHVAGESSGLTLAGAALFFYARLGHALTYIFGIAYVRTLFFFAGIAGIALFLVELLR